MISSQSPFIRSTGCKAFKNSWSWPGGSPTQGPMHMNSVSPWWHWPSLIFCSFFFFPIKILSWNWAYSSFPPEVWGIHISQIFSFLASVRFQSVRKPRPLWGRSSMNQPGMGSLSSGPCIQGQMRPAPADVHWLYFSTCEVTWPTRAAVGLDDGHVFSFQITACQTWDSISLHHTPQILPTSSRVFKNWWS